MSDHPAADPALISAARRRRHADYLSWTVLSLAILLDLALLYWLYRQ